MSPYNKVRTMWEFTGVYLDILHEIAISGTTLESKNALCTSVSKGLSHQGISLQ